MKQIFSKILSSFENNKDGFSARKLSAFILMLNICYIHYRFINSQNAVETIIVDLCGVLVALGIVTAQNIIELKNGNSPDTTSKT